jgi:hypothetical protein
VLGDIDLSRIGGPAKADKRMPEQLQHVLELGGTEVATAAGGARRYRKPLKSFRWRDIQSILTASFGD